MPAALDQMGALVNLEVLNLNQNGLKDLPESFSKFTKLKSLSANTNHIHDLPSKMGNMTALEHLDMKGNDIRVLPYTIVNCSCLKTLNLMDNALEKLPDQIGIMPNLTRIDVAANRLTLMPFSLGFSKVLKDLFIHENPLVDPPLAETSKGLKHLMWYMRNRLHIVNRGMPPVMKYHQTGLQDEVTILFPELKEHVQLMVDKAEKTGFLTLQLMNLKYIPSEVVAMKNLKKLRMDCNPSLSLRLGIPSEFSCLKTLSFKSCRLPDLPDSVENLTQIKHFVLQDNCLEILPTTFTSLTTIMHLGK
jgi:Leucine-rich repeat (LRR) protein